MKKCGNCGASNPDTARFCNECAYALTSLAPTHLAVKTATVSVDAASLATSLKTHGATIQSKRKADVMFVLDCTGSMSGEINAIRDSIIEFANTIEAEGVRVRVGLIEFRDRLNHEEARVLQFKGQPFTAKPDVFRAEVAKLRATGGDDEPESSLDAMMLALQQPFSADANKVIVLITDAPPHIPDKDVRSIDEVTNAIHRVNLDQLYIVMRTQDVNSLVYLKLLEGTRGLVFELGKGDDFRSRSEHFKHTLMQLGKTLSAATV